MAEKGVIIYNLVSQCGKGVARIVCAEELRVKSTKGDFWNANPYCSLKLSFDSCRKYLIKSFCEGKRVFRFQPFLISDVGGVFVLL